MVGLLDKVGERLITQAELGIKSCELQVIFRKESCQQFQDKHFEYKLGNKTKDVKTGC